MLQIATMPKNQVGSPARLSAKADEEHDEADSGA